MAGTFCRGQDVFAALTVNLPYGAVIHACLVALIEGCTTLGVISMECQHIKITAGNLALELAFKVVQIEVTMSVTLALHYEAVSVELSLHVAELVNVTLILLTQDKAAQGRAGIG